MGVKIILHWQCPYCDHLNEQEAQVCAACNGVRPVGKERWRNLEAEKKYLRETVPALERKRKRNNFGCILVCGFFGWGVLISAYQSVAMNIKHKGEVIRSYWQCDVVLEEFRLVRETGRVLPEGATLISSVDITQTPIDSDGYADYNRTETYTEYEYEWETWTEGRSIKTMGDVNEIPYFGEVELAENEREKKRITSYYVIFETKDGNVTKEVDEQQFRQIVEDGYIIYTRAKVDWDTIEYTICN